MQFFNRFRNKSLEAVGNMKSGRRKSPVPSRKHADRSEKGGGGSTSATALLTSTPVVASLNSSTIHLSPGTSNMALPATPSTQSLLVATDDRSHANQIIAPVNAASALEPSSSSLGTATMTVKTADESQSLIDDDLVRKLTEEVEEGASLFLYNCIPIFKCRSPGDVLLFVWR